MSEPKQERKISSTQFRVLEDQDKWLQRMQAERMAEPAEIARRAIDFYAPIYEANAQNVTSAMVIALAEAVRLSDAPTVTRRLEEMVVDLGSGSIADFPVEIRREVRQHAKKIKQRRVVGSR